MGLGFDFFFFFRLPRSPRVQSSTCVEGNRDGRRVRRAVGHRRDVQGHGKPLRRSQGSRLCPQEQPIRKVHFFVPSY